MPPSLGTLSAGRRAAEGSPFLVHGRVAQLVEHRTFNPVAVGSSPTPFTNGIKGLREIVSPFNLALYNTLAYISCKSALRGDL